MINLAITITICFTCYKIACIVYGKHFENNSLFISSINQILKNQKQMSESLDKLTDQVNSLQSSLDTVQEAVAKTIADLNAQIESLKGQLATGATAEELQVVIEKLAATKSDLESTLS